MSITSATGGTLLPGPTLWLDGGGCCSRGTSKLPAPCRGKPLLPLLPPPLVLVAATALPLPLLPRPRGEAAPGAARTGMLLLLLLPGAVQPGMPLLLWLLPPPQVPLGLPLCAAAPAAPAVEALGCSFQLELARGTSHDTWAQGAGLRAQGAGLIP